MEMRKGRDEHGNMSVQMAISMDDPLYPLLMALVRQGRSAVIDKETGFRVDGQKNERAAGELETMLMSMLPEEVRTEVAAECEKARRRKIENTVQQVVQSAGLPGLDVSSILRSLVQPER